MSEDLGLRPEPSITCTFRETRVSREAELIALPLPWGRRGTPRPCARCYLCPDHAQPDPRRRCERLRYGTSRGRWPDPDEPATASVLGDGPQQRAHSGAGEGLGQGLGQFRPTHQGHRVRIEQLGGVEEGAQHIPGGPAPAEPDSSARGGVTTGAANRVSTGWLLPAGTPQVACGRGSLEQVR